MTSVVKLRSLWITGLLLMNGCADSYTDRTSSTGESHQGESESQPVESESQPVENETILQTQKCQFQFIGNIRQGTQERT